MQVAEPAILQAHCAMCMTCLSPAVHEYNEEKQQKIATRLKRKLSVAGIPIYYTK